MDKNDTTVKTEETAVSPEVASSATTIDDSEAKIAQLEAEKARLTEESNNWKVAALKFKSKAKEDLEEGDQDERFRQITREELANSRLAEIAREQDSIIKKALKENKELKLAQLNKTTTSAAVGVHSEGQRVQDTMVTPEQMAHFKSLGWNDKKIELYKKNLSKRVAR